MEVVFLESPISTDELNNIARKAESHTPHLLESLRWFVRHRTITSILAAIREGWRCSGLPLRDWSFKIESARVWRTLDCSEIGLELHLKGSIQPVLQRVPFSSQSLAPLMGTFRAQVPRVIQELALVAPGLQLGVGTLLRPDCIYNRMGSMSDWVSKWSVTPELCASYGCTYPDPRKFLLEVADNGQGCSYVLDTDQFLFFHNYGDLPGLVKCDLSLMDFIVAYCERPATILDPFEMGWAQYPSQGSPQ